MRQPSEPQLTVVIPMYNEEAVLPLLAERLRPVLDGLARSYEVLAVDDGSADDTAAIVMLMRARWPQLRLVRLRRNSGHQAAITAGLRRSRGDHVVTIDADLQDPPEVIAEMIELAERDGLDIVYGVRGDRASDTAFKRGTAALYYRLMRRVVGRHVPPGAGDFRLLSRDMVEALRSLPEQVPVYRLVVPWLGFASGQVTYTRAKRAAGSSKYPLRKMVGLALDSVVSFTSAPLRLAIWLGVLGVLGCLALTVKVLVAYFQHDTVPGWTSLSLIVLTLGACQLVCIGLVGEYVGRVYRGVQGRPAYFVGLDTLDEPAAVPASRDGGADDSDDAQPRLGSRTDTRQTGSSSTTTA